MVKILYVITKSNWGGAQKYVFDLASRLPNDKFEVVVAAGGTGILVQKLAKNNIKTIEIQSLERDINLFKDIKLFWELFKIFRKEKPDIIHLNSSKMGFAGAAAARFYKLKSKIIFTVHGWPFNEDRSVLVKFAFKFIGWLSLVLATKIIFVSDKIKMEAPMFGISRSKFVVIKNGIALQTFYEKEGARSLILEKINPNLFFDKNHIWLGSIAELTKNKGLEFGLEAINKIANKNLHWFIFGEGDLEKKLRNKTKELQIENQVHFLGYLENASAYLLAFDTYLLPSITESLGYTLLEAGLAKIPVVASNIGGIPEIIEDKKTGLLVEPKNSEALAKAITYLLENTKLAKELGKNLNNKITKNFGLEEMLRKTLALYEDLA